jgi:hypothetical protein
LQWNWTNYEDKYLAAVVIYAYPRAAETRGSFYKGRLTGGLSGVAAKFRASFYEMNLLCDGQEVPPIERKKSPVEVPEKYAANPTFAVTSGFRGEGEQVAQISPSPSIKHFRECL